MEKEEKYLDFLLEDTSFSKKNTKKWRINKPFLYESIKIFCKEDYALQENLIEKQNDIISKLDELHKNNIIDLSEYTTKEKVIEKYLIGIQKFYDEMYKEDDKINKIFNELINNK